MRLAFAFLADAAQSTPDGKLWVLGGDFEDLFVPEFPAMHGALALVVRLRVPPLECGQPHRLRVEFVDSDGKKADPQLALEFRAELAPGHPTRDVGAGFVLNFQQIRYERPGDYAFHIFVDDLESGIVPLYVRQSST